MDKKASERIIISRMLNTLLSKSHSFDETLSTTASIVLPNYKGEHRQYENDFNVPGHA